MNVPTARERGLPSGFGGGVRITPPNDRGRRATEDPRNGANPVAEAQEAERLVLPAEGIGGGESESGQRFEMGWESLCSIVNGLPRDF